MSFRKRQIDKLITFGIINAQDEGNGGVSANTSDPDGPVAAGSPSEAIGLARGNVSEGAEGSGGQTGSGRIGTALGTVAGGPIGGVLGGLVEQGIREGLSRAEAQARAEALIGEDPGTRAGTPSGLGPTLSSDASGDPSDVFGGSFASWGGIQPSGDIAQAVPGSELEFQFRRYQNWLDVFGDVQQNLSTFFQELTPDSLAVAGLQAFEVEQNQQLKELRANLAQRGLAQSGASIEAETQFAQQGAVERARIRQAAPLQVAQEQERFLQIGLGQDPSASLAGSLAAGDQAQRAKDLEKQRLRGELTAAGAEILGAAAEEFLFKS